MTDRQERYLDRELSWLQFNRRVQSLTQREDFPLLERLRFAAITASNLEEFFSVRVSGVERKLAAEVDRVGFTGIEPKVLLQRIRREVVRQEHQLQQLVAEQLLPGLAGHGLRVARIDELSPAEREEVAELFWHEVVPELTPVPFSVDWNFPPLRNLSLGVVAQLRRRGDDQYAFVGVPAHLQRFLQLADGRTFVALEHVMVALLPELFKRARVTGSTVIRVVRDMDVEFDEESIEDPASARRRIERGLRERGSGNVVRLQVLGDGVPQIWPQLRRVLGVKRRHLYAVPTFVALDSFLQLVDTPGFDELRLPRIRPAAVPRLEQSDSASMFEEIARKDVLLHHPYNDFSTTVERFERTAVEDPDVLAIKHTLYRTSADSSVVPALIAARNRHRRAVCLVELKARFDEPANVRNTERLRAAGVEVIHGAHGHKVHAKIAQVVRREG
ncbi:MAG: RNA degradosome polyphosphate kinase, partial [Thermoleophilia bacterium]|nr:RNA degradosome polyphosphate kinase [Thermoleophilia bacterium]